MIDMGGSTRRIGFGVISWVGWLTLTTIVFLMLPVSTKAYASVSLTQPVSQANNSPFGMRNGRPHRGLDYLTPCGTRMQTRGGTTRCGVAGGYGNLAEVTHSCGVMERYAHLQGCNSNGELISGGDPRVAGSGTSTGCHLHYEIRLNGVAIDPNEAFGQDLCDPDVQRRLRDSAQAKLNGQAGGGGGMSGTGGTGAGGTQGGNTPPAGQGTGQGINDDPNIQSIEYVPTGGTDPRTGVVNTGPGYYNIQTTDGRVRTQIDQTYGSSTAPALPAGTPANVTPTGAGGGDVSGCATDTWTAMVNRSVLETRREVVMNNFMVTKPDSILAYACFHEQMKPVREQLGPIFSESKRWVNLSADLRGKTVTINKELGEFSLDGALTNLVMEPYEAYMRSFFSHDFLGGLEAIGAGSHAGHAHADDQAYKPCNAMNLVWKMAKCKNFDYVPSFYTFEELVSRDPRQFPKGYECNNTGISTTMIQLAKNGSVQKSPYLTYFDRLLAESGNCAPPVMTGVTVVRQEGMSQISQEATYADGVCISAGCSFEKSGSTGGGQCVRR